MSRFPDQAHRAAALACIAVVLSALLGACGTSKEPTATSTAPESSSTAHASAPAAPPSNGVKPTVVLVHGAWADTSSWDGEVSDLRKQGYDARAIANPLEDLTTDADSLRPVKQFFHVRMQVDKGKPKAIVEPPASASGK